MRRHILLLSLVVSCVFIFLNEGGAEEVLTWQDCVNEAQKNNPDLISAKEVVNQYKADKAIAISPLLPQISTEVSQRTSHSTQDIKTDTAGYGITAQQLLFDGLKTPYDIAAAAKNLTSARYNYKATSSDIRLSLRTAFAELLKAQELLTITKDIAVRRKQNADLVKLLYEGGREHRGSLLTAQANLAQAEFDVAQAQRTITVAQRQLTKELGRAEFKPIQVSGTFESTNPTRERPHFEDLAADNPSLEALAAKKEAARFSLKAAKAEFFPQIYANAQAGMTDSHWLPRDDEWSAGVILAFPLFEGGRRWANVSKAKAVLNQAQADERSNRNSVIVTLEESWTSWQDAMDTVSVRKKFLQAAEERARIARAQYENGLISFDNWTIIEDDLVQAQKTFLNAQTTAIIAEAQWVNAQGGTLEHGE